jgi:hypothetical protein
LPALTRSARVGYLPDLNARLRALQAAGAGGRGSSSGGGAAALPRPLTLEDFLPAAPGSDDATYAGGGAAGADAMPLMAAPPSTLDDATVPGAYGYGAVQSPLPGTTTSVPLPPSPAGGGNDDDFGGAGGGVSGSSSYARLHRAGPNQQQPVVAALQPPQKWHYAVPVGAPLPPPAPAPPAQPQQPH